MAKKVVKKKPIKKPAKSLVKKKPKKTEEACPFC
jgi:hypothetical protein